MSQRKKPCLGEEVDAVGDCVHGDRMSSNEKTSKVHSGQVVQLGIQTGQLPDVIADHVEQALGHVFFRELYNSEKSCINIQANIRTSLTSEYLSTATNILTVQRQQSFSSCKNLFSIPIMKLLTSFLLFNGSTKYN